MSAAAIAGPATSPSPFSTLLRRSRFASYDPFIRQAYSAPPDHASRGSWGLKRSLPLKRRDAFITVSNSFESPHQFIDWNNAESQVRFVRRFEEMGVYPGTHVPSRWGKRIDPKNLTNCIIDSEFCERDEGPEVEEKEEPEPIDVPQTMGMRSDLPTLGQSGKGAYGAHRPIVGTHSSVTPNIYAMSNKEFERYLKKLRALRPKFKEHLAKVADSYTDDKGAYPLKGKSLYELAQNAHNSEHHRLFLAAHTAAELKTPENKLIEPRPHINAGLMYARIPYLNSYLYNRKEKGIILHVRTLEPPPKKGAERQQLLQTKNVVPTKQLIVSFGGLTSILPEEDVISHNRNPAEVALFSYNKVPTTMSTAPSPFTHQTSEGRGIGPAILPMRLAAATLETAPIVVGHRKQGLKAVRMQTVVTTQTHKERPTTSNPFTPGTFVYMAMDRPSTVEDEMYQLESESKGPFQPSMKPQPKKTIMSKEDTVQLLSTLTNMVGTKNTNVEDDEGL